MAIRKIIRIDESKCDGCGDCVSACHEGAIQIIDGKAKLVSETYCDGLGACIGDCPVGAITIEERDAAEFDEAAVQVHLQRQATQPKPKPAHAAMSPLGGCPGSAARSFAPAARTERAASSDAQSALSHWPVQLMLVPPHAPYLQGANLLICADCVPFAFADFHSRYLAGRALLIGCPKLDDLQFYFDKLKQVFAVAKPSSVLVLKMEVPCCNGIAQAAIAARNEVAPQIPLQVVTISIQGQPLEQRRSA